MDVFGEVQSDDPDMLSAWGEEIGAMISSFVLWSFIQVCSLWVCLEARQFEDKHSLVHHKGPDPIIMEKSRNENKGSIK